jgi:predicted dienelactone hydrolase
MLRVVCLMLAFGVASLAFAYDPLSVSMAKSTPKEFTVSDAKRKREIPLRVYLPADDKPAPVILFSHGLGGSNKGSAFLGEHWAKRGYVAVFLQHAGSDDGVWKDTEKGARMGAMKKAASAQNLILRVQDVPATLDQLEAWNKADQHPLRGRLDMSQVGMSGHSFGAATTQAVSGQKFPIGNTTDPRIRAAVIFSPNAAKGGSAETAFAGVKIPWFILTGTHDDSPIGGDDAKARQLVYPALPTGDKYQLTLWEAEHSFPTETKLPGEKYKRNPNHHKAVMATTTAFFDAYLKNDAEAKRWLQGEAVRNVLEKEDVWQKK